MKQIKDFLRLDSLDLRLLQENISLIVIVIGFYPFLRDKFGCMLNK